jgi:hypothetical protein
MPPQTRTGEALSEAKMRLSFLIFLSFVGVAVAASHVQHMRNLPLPQRWACVSDSTKCEERALPAESVAPQDAGAKVAQETVPPPPVVSEPIKPPVAASETTQARAVTSEPTKATDATTENGQIPEGAPQSWAFGKWSTIDLLAAALLLVAAIQTLAFLRQGRQLRKTVAATAVAADAAQKSAEALQRMEAGYLFLRDPFDGNIRNPKAYAQPLPNLSANIIFKNHGRTPVTIRRLNQAYVYVAKLDDIYSVPRTTVTLPPGVIVAAGAESQTFKCALNFSVDELTSVSNGKGLIVYVVTVDYEDIFMRKRVLGLCRVYSGGVGFFVDGDTRVNFND